MTAFPKPVREEKPRRPLKRKTYMRPKRPRRIARGLGDPAYLAFVHTLPCVVRSVRCAGPIHAHHAIHRSQGGKDHDAVPLCMVHHSDWHTHSGPFFTLSKLERWAWAMRVIAETRARWVESLR